MQDIAAKTAFITGGASGIGLGMARVFVREGMNAVLADIRQDHLDEAQALFGADGLADRVLTVRLDVTDRDAYERAADAAERRFGKVHILCNNAGMGLGGPIKQTRHADWDWGIGVMITGVTNGITIMLPRILKHGEGGHIVNTSSKAALVPVSGFAIYGTCKAAMTGLSEAIRAELAGDNIGVSCFCPGPVQSNIRETGRTRPEHLKADSGLLQEEAELERRPNSPLWMDPIECGERVLAGIRRNDLYILTHPEFKAGTAEKFAAILKSFPDEPINEARADSIRYILTNAIFKDMAQAPGRAS